MLYKGLKAVKKKIVFRNNFSRYIYENLLIRLQVFVGRNTLFLN